MKKKIVRLTEGDLHNMIKQCINEAIAQKKSVVLNEMGTIAQNKYLKALAGNDWKPEWEYLPVSETSKLIDFFKNRKERGGATNKQIDWIATNKYLPVPEIKSVINQITKDDASNLYDALQPYTGNRNARGYSIRDRKEFWLPRVREYALPILQKYNLNDAVTRISAYIDKELGVINRKIERQRQKLEKEKIARFEEGPKLVFISTQDEENMAEYDGRAERISHNVYMHGDLESKMGWDIASMVTELSYLSKEDIKTACEKRIGNFTLFPSKVIGYDKPCYLVAWIGRAFEKLEVTGYIIAQDEYSQIRDICDKKASELNGKM